MPEKIEDLADDILPLITGVALTLHDPRRSTTHPRDVTPLDAVLLQHISDGSSTLVDLCDRTGRLKGTISKRLARARRRLWARQASPHAWQSQDPCADS
jgi:hypothetical protein